MRRWLAVAALGLVLLAGLGLGVRVLLYDAGLADVETVEVTGAQTVTVQDVLAAAGVEPGVPLAAVDTAGVAVRVGALPGVGTVDVGRSLLHTVTVAVTERVPVAIADTPQGPALVDVTGLPYKPASAASRCRGSTFPGVGPDDAATRSALAVLAALPEPLRTQVQTVDVGVSGSGAGQVTLGLTDDRQVRWGTPDRAAEKAAVLGPLLTQSGRVYDVASPELPTVRR